MTPITRLDTMYITVTLAIFPKRLNAPNPELYNVIKFVRKADMEIRITSVAFSAVPQKYCESIVERIVTIANPINDRITTILTMVRWTAEAVSNSFFPKCSDTNLVSAVGKFSRHSVKAEAMKVRVERIPKSAGVRELVLVTVT